MHYHQFKCENGSFSEVRFSFEYTTVKIKPQLSKCNLETLTCFFNILSRFDYVNAMHMSPFLDYSWSKMLSLDFLNQVKASKSTWAQFQLPFTGFQVIYKSILKPFHLFLSLLMVVPHCFFFWSSQMSHWFSQVSRPANLWFAIAHQAGSFSCCF